ncbi:hypothetical protein ACFVTF_03645 [Kitasatospora sp. NPDC057940]
MSSLSAREAQQVAQSLVFSDSAGWSRPFEGGHESLPVSPPHDQ